MLNVVNVVEILLLKILKLKNNNISTCCCSSTTCWNVEVHSTTSRRHFQSLLWVTDSSKQSHAVSSVGSARMVCRFVQWVDHEVVRVARKVPEHHIWCLSPNGCRVPLIVEPVPKKKTQIRIRLQATPNMSTIGRLKHRCYGPGRNFSPNRTDPSWPKLHGFC